MSLHEAVTYFSDYENCREFMMALRWPDGKVSCPRCGSDHVAYLANQRKWKCYAKHHQPTFTLKTGTVFEDSPVSLDKWIVATWMIVNCRNGISSWELHRSLGVTQKTAWFMLHRVRLAMQDDLTGGNLGGEVEVDESFIGGKARNMHADRKKRAMNGRKGGALGSNKTIVLGMLERKGESKGQGRVRATIIEDRNKESMRAHVGGNVEKGATIHSDEFASKWRNDADYTHMVVNHAEKYVDGQVHTNGLENFWSLLKRSLGGTYVSAEPFHLFRYIDEQAFRYNSRRYADGEIISDYERLKMALKQIVDRRLTYAALTGKVQETAEAF